MSNKPLQPGDRVGNYILREVIGEGAFAQVWKAAHHERPARVVTVKIATDDTFRRQLSREGRLPDINHPNVVPILDADTRFADHPYIVMPFYKGGSLAGLISQYPNGLPEDRVTAVLRDIVAGLSAAHEQGIVHRDIKPSNILIGDDSQALISDFGLSLNSAAPDARQSIIQSTSLSREAPRGIAGTLAYLAPEVMNGRDPDPASDVYAVGILIFELLTGRLPCGPEKPSDVISNINRRFDWDRFYSFACSTLEKRPQTASSLATLFGRISESTARLRKASTKEDQVVLVGAIVAVALVGITVGAGFFNSYIALAGAWSVAVLGSLFVFERHIAISSWKALSLLVTFGVIFAIPFGIIFAIARLVWTLIH